MISLLNLINDPSRCRRFAFQSMLSLSLALIVCFSPLQLAAQKSPEKQVTPADSITVPLHSPKKASIYSAVLPGLGQAYNHKYWKIPIIYAGFGALAYFVNVNYSEYQKFKEAYIWKVSGDTIPINNEYIYKYQSAEQLKSGKNYYLRNFELTCILTGVWYILNILDATVDAHLLNYDINEDLSLQLQPGFAQPDMASRQPVAGLTLTLKLK